MSLRTVVMALGFLLCGCPPVSRTFEVRRSALVPHLVPALGDGRRPVGTVQVQGALSTIAATAEPDHAPNDESGIYVAMSNLALGGRVHLVRGLEVGPLFEVGLSGDTIRGADDIPAKPDGTVLGFGASLRYTIAPRASRLSLGLGVDLLAYSIPYREEVTCLSGCFGDPFTVEESRHWLPVVSLSMMPAWTPVDAFTLHAIFGFRNHPSNSALEIVEDPDADDGVEEARPGPFNVIAGLGVSVKLDPRLAVFANLTQSVNGAPLRYGPTFAGGLSVSLGKGPLARRRRRPAPPAEGEIPIVANVPLR